MKGRLFSVVVPVYNVEDYLDRCVRSLVEQTYRNIEIILVDDGSPDRCPEICDKWAEKDPRIVVIHKENGGLSDARNAGIAVLKGEYFLLVDSDDYIETDAIMRFDRELQDEDLLVADFMVHRGENTESEKRNSVRAGEIYSGTEFAWKTFGEGTFYAGACHQVYRTRFVTEQQLFFRKGLLHEDIEYQPRLFAAAKKVRYLPYPFYHYLLREASICGSRNHKNRDDLFLIYGEWKKRNDGLKSPEEKKVYGAILVRYFLATCRDHKIAERVYPEGIGFSYLFRYAASFREKLKVLFFFFLRPIYVRL